MICSKALECSNSREIFPPSNMRWWLGHNTTTLSKKLIIPSRLGIIWQTSTAASSQPHMQHLFGKRLLTKFRKWLALLKIPPLNAGLFGPRAAHLLEQNLAPARLKGTSNERWHTSHTFVTLLFCASCIHSSEQNLLPLAKLGSLTTNGLPQTKHLRVTGFLYARHLGEQNLRLRFASLRVATKSLPQFTHFRVTLLFLALSAHCFEQCFLTLILDGLTLNSLPHIWQTRVGIFSCIHAFVFNIYSIPQNRRKLFCAVIEPCLPEERISQLSKLLEVKKEIEQ